MVDVVCGDVVIIELHSSESCCRASVDMASAPAELETQERTGEEEMETSKLLLVGLEIEYWEEVRGKRS